MSKTSVVKTAENITDFIFWDKDTNLCILPKLQVAVIVNSSRYLGHTYFEIYVQSLEEKGRACSINQSAALPSSCLNMHIAYNEMKAWFCDKLIKKVVDGCIVLPGFFIPSITIHFYTPQPPIKCTCLARTNL